ncbi:hypothetical protein [Gluconobacter sp. DsW_056]|uniref:hypothetical protein n=1 Tax=Gluconobacter sp. DsW_056 TaxID=1511209 RepID=UPI00117A0776|nr:hypothetical protein [Gluconobacter sp. DsW_056]
MNALDLAKMNVTNGMAVNPTLSGGHETLTPPAGDNNPAIASTAYVDRAVNNIRLQTVYQRTITVCASGCNYASVVEGFNAALNASHRLATHGVVTVQIADGTYRERDQVFTNDPASSAVQILGNLADKSKVQINFTNIASTNQSGFIAVGGGQIGLIDGLTINGVGAQATNTAMQTTWKNQSYGAGIIAQGGSVINLGSHLDIEHFYYGVEADDGGVINARLGGVAAGDAGDVAFMARGNGVIVCPSCTANRASDMTDPNTAKLGFCFDAERGGALYIDGSTCTAAAVSGVYALTNGKAWAHSVTVSKPLLASAMGIYALSGGAIEAQGSTITGMGTGINSHDGGWVECNGCSITRSSGDNVIADGGLFLASGAKNTGAGAYGYHAIHQGTIRLYGAVSNTKGNAAGNFSAEGAGTQNGVAFSASSIFVRN